MRKSVSRALWGAFFIGGLSLLGVGAAHADTTSGEDGAVSGNQILPVLTVPVTLGGNAISILGDSASSSASTPAPAQAAPVPARAQTSGTDSLAGGNQVNPAAAVPVTLGGNAISVLGDSHSTGSSTATPAVTSGSGSTTSGSDGIADGSQVIPDVTFPVTVGGNAISVLGDSSSSGTVVSTRGTGGSNGTPGTDGTEGTAGGNQVVPVVNLPITIGANAISVFGESETADGTTVIEEYPTDPTDPTNPTDPTDPTDPAFPGGDSENTPVVPGDGTGDTGNAGGAGGTDDGAYAPCLVSAAADGETGPNTTSGGFDPTAGALGLLLLACIGRFVAGRVKLGMR